ncbi:MAG: hypothetical protein NZ773_13015 [Dehalococcoidia bacterium]|nr:hypothetical protein [Dehalococcoidia bacterium]
MSIALLRAGLRCASYLAPASPAIASCAREVVLSGNGSCRRAARSRRSAVCFGPMDERDWLLIDGG